MLKEIKATIIFLSFYWSFCITSCSIWRFLYCLLLQLHGIYCKSSPWHCRRFLNCLQLQLEDQEIHSGRALAPFSSCGLIGSQKFGEKLFNNWSKSVRIFSVRRRFIPKLRDATAWWAGISASSIFNSCKFASIREIRYNIKNPGLNEESGVSLSWRRPTLPLYAVPSALSGITSLFGMGRGGTPTL